MKHHHITIENGKLKIENEEQEQEQERLLVTILNTPRNRGFSPAFNNKD
jgi:hypothetical protein